MFQLDQEQINSVCIDASANLFEALQCLEDCVYKTLFVVETGNKLMGSVTDGDIRRAMLMDADVDQKIISVMNQTPIFVYERDLSSLIPTLSSHNDVNLIPILNCSGHILSVIANDYSQQDRIENNFIIMAGGLGMRLRPYTDNIPKPMLNIGGRPILEWIIERAQNSGFVNFIISTNYLGEQIEEYFGDGRNLGINIKYVREKERLGTAGALGNISLDIEAPCIVCNGDVISDIKFDELLGFHNLTGADATMTIKDYATENPYGVVDHDGIKFSKILEKPVTYSSINAGVYCISNNILKNLSGQKKMDMTTLFEMERKKGKKIHVYPHAGHWLDIGQKQDYEAAQINFQSGGWNG